MARKKTAKKVAYKTTRKKTVTRSAPRAGGESALIGQGPSWWKLGKPVDPGFRRTAPDDQPSRPSPPPIPVGIYPQTIQPAQQPSQPQVETGLELFGIELDELDSEYLPDDMIPLDGELTTDVDDLLNGAEKAIDSLLDGSLEDLLAQVDSEVAPEATPELAPEDILDDDLDATEYFPPEVDGLLEVPQDVMDVVEKEMPVQDESGIADPADFVDLFGVDDELETEPAAVEEPPEPSAVEEEPEAPVAEEAPVEEPPVAEPPVPVQSSPPAPVEVPSAEPVPAPSPARQPLIVTILLGLNYPLRALSPSSRLVVDWVAWSLMFWVPVVLIIAIVVVGR
jgi:hypothetical protein